MQKIEVEVEGGRLVATANADPNYPGIDVEFIPSNDNGEEGVSNPRLLMEKPMGDELRALIWGNKNVEDFTAKVKFC